MTTTLKQQILRVLRDRAAIQGPLAAFNDFVDIKPLAVDLARALEAIDGLIGECMLTHDYPDTGDVYDTFLAALSKGKE